MTDVKDVGESGQKQVPPFIPTGDKPRLKRLVDDPVARAVFLQKTPQETPTQPQQRTERSKHDWMPLANSAGKILITDAMKFDSGVLPPSQEVYIQERDVEDGDLVITALTITKQGDESKTYHKISKKVSRDGNFVIKANPVGRNGTESELNQLIESGEITPEQKKKARFLISIMNRKLGKVFDKTRAGR